MSRRGTKLILEWTPKTSGSSAPSPVTSGLIAQYLFLDGSGTNCHDSSGNGNDATLDSNRSFLVFPSWITGGGLNFSGYGQQVDLPSAVSSAAQTIQMLINPNYQLQYPFLAGNDDGTWGVWLLNYYNNLTVNDAVKSQIAGMWNLGVAGGCLDYAFQNTPQVVTWTNDGTQDLLYFNDSPPIMIAPTNVTREGNIYLGNNINYGDNSDVGFTGSMGPVLVYNRAVSAAEVVSNYNYLKTFPMASGIPVFNPATGSTLGCIGDSITYGLGTTNPWPVNLVTTRTYQTRNFGVDGQTLASATVTDFDKVKYWYASAGVKNVVTIWLGTNDIALLGSTPGATFALLTAFVARFIAIGSKVIVIPMISRTGYDTQKNELNSLSWGYSWGPNVQVIQSNDAYMGSGSAFNYFADGAYSNSTYFNSDGVHPTQTGSTLSIVPAVSAQVNAVG
jgi:trimeric autotransporter adhesin